MTEALFGDYNPAGRLPITFYRGTSDLPAFDDYNIANGRTYMYYQQEPLFPFGHGLSYTSFEYSGLRLELKNDTLHVDFDVANVGSVDGDEVPQVYLRFPSQPRPLPIKQLQGFDRVSIAAGAQSHLSIPIAVADLRLWDDEAEAFYTPQGDYAVMVGASSADIRLQQMWHLGDSSGIVTELEGVTVRVSGSDLLISSMAHNVDARIYSPDGRLVSTLPNLQGLHNHTLPDGIYLVAITDGNASRTYKVIIK